MDDKEFERMYYQMKRRRAQQMGAPQLLVILLGLSAIILGLCLLGFLLTL